MIAEGISARLRRTARNATIRLARVARVHTGFRSIEIGKGQTLESKKMGEINVRARVNQRNLVGFRRQQPS